MLKVVTVAVLSSLATAGIVDLGEFLAGTARG